MPLQTPPPVPPAIIEVAPIGTGWTMTSSDGLFFGLFRDRTSAVRHAFDEADGHPGHVVIVRDESLAD